MRIAVIIPCLNEEATVAKVVSECKKHLPGAHVYVLDNGSSDSTAHQALASGADVIYSPLRGKGNVLHHAFRLVDADYFVMIDGDGTYPIEEAPRLIEIARKYNYEMVMGSRLKLGERQAFRRFHFFGNRLFTKLVQWLFGFPVQDLLTGFRIFSRAFAQEIHLVSSGFEVETELTIRAMAQKLAFCEIPISYSARPVNSHSKLRTFSDGWRILWTIVRFLKDFRPLLFYSLLSGLSLGLSPWIKAPYSTATILLSALFLALGFGLDSLLNWQRLRLTRPKLSQPSNELKKSA